MHSVLVIDDERLITNMIQLALTRYGFRVETAANGNEGVRKFDREDFDLVITDMKMPGMDGRGVVGHIRRSSRGRTPIIGISGTPWMLEGVDFDRKVVKPFQLDSLIKVVNELSDLPQSRLPRS